MYEFIKTATGWLVYWGPAPRTVGPSPSRQKTESPSTEGRSNVPASVEPPTHPRPAAPVAARR